MKLKNYILSIYLILILSLTSCIDAPQAFTEPQEPDSVTYEALGIYETELNSYVMYLIAFLDFTTSKIDELKNTEFPLFNARELKTTENIENLKYNITLYKKYINIIKPTVLNIFNKYAKIKAIKEWLGNENINK